MRRGFILLSLAMVIGFNGLSQASLMHIGFATYDDGSANIGSYKLIYDYDLELTWLDYTNPTVAGWQTHMDSAASLNNPGVLEFYSLSGITMNWAGEVWRLPMSGRNPVKGYYQTDSEMGHLYYTELGN